MRPAHDGPAFTLYVGDCRQVLPAALGDASIDAIVTDPPYEIGFMGAAWDREGVAYDAHTWAECLRVLKPGGHLLVFGGPRTYHRMACAVEDAGFELRDSIMWIHGQGFPKGLDVGKAVDKRRDDKREVREVCRWLRARIVAHPDHTFRTLGALFGFHPRMVEHWAANDTDSQPAVPTVEQWARLREVLGFGADMDHAVERLNARKGTAGEAYNARPVTGTVEAWQNRTSYAMTGRDNLRREVPVSDHAFAWAGWNTALKPAHEPILCARKPLDGTVADTVLAHGTGALNIGACRVSTSDDTGRTRTTALGLINDDAWQPREQSSESHPGGRWPTNVLLSHLPECLDGGPCAAGCALVELDAQSGVLTSGANPRRRGADGERTAFGAFAGQADARPARGVDVGGASRFFPAFRYQPKAGKAERPVVDGLAHATVKPLALVAWLVRLVAPAGAVVLDPFLGSGTTAQACEREGMRCVGVEREPKYVPLIMARLGVTVPPRLPPSTRSLRPKEPAHERL